MISRKTDLIRAFQLQDRNKSGKKLCNAYHFITYQVTYKCALIFFASLRLQFYTLPARNDRDKNKYNPFYA